MRQVMIRSCNEATERAPALTFSLRVILRSYFQSMPTASNFVEPMFFNECVTGASRQRNSPRLYSIVSDCFPGDSTSIFAFDRNTLSADNPCVCMLVD